MLGAARASSSRQRGACGNAMMLSATGMADQGWHTDSTASLAYVVALEDDVRATEFLQLPSGRRWIDVMACGPETRNAFLESSWKAVDANRVLSAGLLRAGDVVFFYTQARAPCPADAEARRSAEVHALRSVLRGREERERAADERELCGALGKV